MKRDAFAKKFFKEYFRTFSIVRGEREKERVQLRERERQRDRQRVRVIEGERRGIKVVNGSTLR